MTGAAPLWQRTLARVPGTRPGSKWRNLFSYGAALAILALAAEAIAAAHGRAVLDNPVAGPGLIVLAAVYFLVVVVGVIFLTSERFSPAPVRLARDTLISIALTVLSFSVFYRNAGISLDASCPDTVAASDAVYFSAVTFSTLGYGDFRPCPDAATRLIAASQAIFGNLHLGLIVGAAFFFAQGKLPNATGVSEEGRPDHDERSETGDD